MKRLAAWVLASAAMVAAAADTPADYRLLLDTLHITSVRPGADGWKADVPNAVNYEENRAGSEPLPDPLKLENGKRVNTAKMWWTTRRPEVVAAFDRDVYGSVPAHVPAVTWRPLRAEVRDDGVITQVFQGHTDNRLAPAITVDIALNLTLPANVKHPVPVMIVLSWTGKWVNMPIPPEHGRDWRQQLLAAGWGYAELIPITVQPDDPNGLRQGIIGLTNRGAPRPPGQWGALRAWAWGVSRSLDLLAGDPRIDAKRIGVAGHSRYGKAALVAMAYDPRIAIGYISSSGAGGAKLLRRDFGERLENLAGDGEYHWMAGNFVRYAGPKTVRDLPVDGHDLIALCAPRPVFIGSGTREAGDGWVDPRGMFLAAVAAGPVYRLLGAGDLGTADFPPVGTLTTKGALAFRQHPFGHTIQPNWEAFLGFAKERLP